MKNETTFLSTEKKKNHLHQKCWKQIKQRMHCAEGHESTYVLQKCSDNRQFRQLSLCFQSKKNQLGFRFLNGFVWSECRGNDSHSEYETFSISWQVLAIDKILLYNPFSAATVRKRSKNWEEKKRDDSPHSNDVESPVTSESLSALTCLHNT